MQQGHKNEGGDSDNDEGFVVHTVEIKQKEQMKIIVHSKERPSDYQPRYLNNHPLMRKEPNQIIYSFPHFPNDELAASTKISRKKDRENMVRIQQSTFPNKNYQLVYQRTVKQATYASLSPQNNVGLNSVINYLSDNYSVLKAWEMRSNDEQLQFQSRFQCGNLYSVYRSCEMPNHYVLFLSNDTNSNGYNKWFYFAVRNKLKNVSYTFSIVNFRKNMPFFRQGMKPTRFSLKSQEKTGNGWSRVVNRVYMYRSKIGDDSQSLSYNQHYTLTFEVTFEHENDTSFFSLLPPYSYSKLVHFLDESKKLNLQQTDVRYKYSTIGYSLSNTQIPYITISGNEPSKRNIVILGRQHPGQIWSSYLIQSLIRQLLRDSFAQKDWLLKNFTFRIFPMLNVDGVIYGNFRCDLGGTDMNRSWKQPNKLLHPHLVAVKQEIRRLCAEEEVVSCFDMHSHSKDYNMFAYCCKTDGNGRVLPYLLSRMTNLFYFPYCTFGVSKYKETTARAVIYDMARAPDVLTIESSFFANNNPLKMLTPSSFITFSNALIKTLKHYYARDKEHTEAETDLPKVMAEIAQMRTKNRQKYALKDESGSDSDPQVDQIALTEKIGNIIPKCSLVEQAFGIKESKEKLQSLSKSKKPRLQKSKPKQKKKLAVSRNTISQDQNTTKVEKPPIILSKPRSNSNTVHNFLDRIFKKKQKDNKKEQRRKPEQTMKNMKYLVKSERQERNESLQLERERKTLNNFLNSEFRSTFREKKLKYMVEEIHDRKEDEFPMLCVLSDSKKEAHLEKMRRIHPTPVQKEKPVVRYQPTFVVNKKMDTMQRLRQRQKKSSDLVSSLWKDTLGYHEEGPVSHIFYG